MFSGESAAHPFMPSSHRNLKAPDLLSVDSHFVLDSSHYLKIGHSEELSKKESL